MGVGDKWARGGDLWVVLCKEMHMAPLRWVLLLD